MTLTIQTARSCPVSREPALPSQAGGQATTLGGGEISLGLVSSELTSHSPAAHVGMIAPLHWKRFLWSFRDSF